MNICKVPREVLKTEGEARGFHSSRNQTPNQTFLKPNQSKIRKEDLKTWGITLGLKTEGDTQGFQCIYRDLINNDYNRGIKDDFPVINIRKVPREVLKTEGEARGFQPSRGTLRMLMNGNIILIAFVA